MKAVLIYGNTRLIDEVLNFPEQPVTYEKVLKRNKALKEQGIDNRWAIIPEKISSPVLELNDFLDFLVGIDYNKITTYMQDKSDVGDHIVGKLNAICDEYKLLSPQAVIEWILHMDHKHQKLIQEYIIENHKF